MNNLENTNLRGIRISPQVKEDAIHYYLCIIDQPISAVFDPSKLTVAEIEADATEIKVHYTGKLVNPTETDTIRTYMIPLITSQQLKNRMLTVPILKFRSPMITKISPKATLILVGHR